MDYLAGKKKGEPVGSGAVESTGRQYQCCFKRTGQFWSTVDDEALLSLKTTHRNNVKQYVSDLRDRIETLIPGIEGDIITYDKRENTYNTTFRISSEESLQFPTPDGTAWTDVTISAKGLTGIRIWVTATERLLYRLLSSRHPLSARSTLYSCCHE